jgi:hypothetical protein
MSADKTTRAVGLQAGGRSELRQSQDADPRSGRSDIAKKRFARKRRVKHLLLHYDCTET